VCMCVRVCYVCVMRGMHGTGMCDKGGQIRFSGGLHSGPVSCPLKLPPLTRIMHLYLLSLLFKHELCARDICAARSALSPDGAGCSGSP